MAFAQYTVRMGLAPEDLAHQRREMIEGQAVVIRVETRLIPALAEGGTTVETGMIAVAVAGVSVPAIMMPVI